jgi:O-antigen/teichoic acid export membrane protein
MTPPARDSGRGGATEAIDTASIGATVRTSLWGIADQGLLSVTSFVTVVVLASVLGPHAFGSFSIVYTALLIANALQTALVTQPHNVIGVTKAHDEYTGYTGTTLAIQLVFAVAVSGAALAGAVLAAGVDAALAPLLFALVPAALAWQLQEFGRRVLYTEGRLAAAFANDVISYGGQIALLALLWRFASLDGPNALYAIAASSAAGAAFGAWQLRRSIMLAFDRASVRANWRFGKWLGGATLGFILSSHLYTYLAATIVGAFAAGVLKAAQVLLGPLNVLLLFLNNVLPIRLARAHAIGGESMLRRRLGLAYLVTFPIVASYCVACSVFAGPLLGLVYGEEYDQYGPVVVLFAVHYLLTYLGQLVSNALYAKRSTRPVFLGNAAGAVVAVAFGWLLVAALGVEGAVVGMIISLAATNLIIASGFLAPRRWLHPEMRLPFSQG